MIPRAKPFCQSSKKNLAERERSAKNKECFFTMCIGLEHYGDCYGNREL